MGVWAQNFIIVKGRVVVMPEPENASVWKLHKTDGGHRDLATGKGATISAEYPSREDALDAGCKLPAHVHAEFIEGPNGQRIEKTEIEEHCAARARNAQA
jgi:hypothetical protein